MTKARRTQAERRAETRAAVLDSACRIFGEKGYAQTSIEEIASASGVTIRPIYHYFGNKLALFEAVNALMEDRIVASIDDSSDEEPGRRTLAAWRAFLDLCSEPRFRQIALIDAPTVLGRDRWAEGSVAQTASAFLRGGVDAGVIGSSELATRILIAALAEAALFIAESDDPERSSREADGIITRLLEAFRSGAESSGGTP